MSSRALGPGQAVRGSWALLRRRPIVILSLATALLTSLFAVCCGLGMLAAPWFMCELFAVQIRIGIERSTPRTRAWLWAGFIQMLAVLVLSSLAFLSLLALGPDVLLGGSMEGGRTTDARLVETLGLLFGAGSVAIALVVHFEHAPAILIDRGGGLTSALLESARLVSASGPVRTWLTSVSAHGLQLAPALLATALAIAHGTLATTLTWGVFLLPWLALGLALGQGMMVSSYLALRGDSPVAVDPDDVPARATVLGAFVLLLVVMAGPLTVSIALFKPARVEQGTLTANSHVLLDRQADGQVREVYLPDSALRLSLSTRRVRVLASDGGGVGTLPLPNLTVERVRAARVLPPRPLHSPSLPEEPVFALEVQFADGSSRLTFIDDAGVRLDDSLAQRFDQRLPATSTLPLLACLFAAAFWTARVLPPLARARLELAGPERERATAAFAGRARRALLWLVPPALLSLLLSAWTLLH